MGYYELKSVEWRYSLPSPVAVSSAVISVNTAFADSIEVMTCPLSLVRLDHNRVLSIAAASHPFAQSAAVRISGATVRYLRDTREISALVPGSIWRLSELKH